MIAQKQTYIPTVNSVPIQDYPADADFTTDPIEFKDSHKDWSISVFFDVEAGGALMSLVVSNEQFGEYLPYKDLCTNIDLDQKKNRSIFDDIMPFRYMKIMYACSSATGNISIKMSI